MLNPKFSDWDVKEAAKKLEEDIKTLADNPQSLLLEVGACPNVMRSSAPTRCLQSHTCCVCLCCDCRCNAPRGPRCQKPHCCRA